MLLIGSFDGVDVKVSRRDNLFWIAHDRGYKLGPPRGLTDPIRNVRKIQGWVILKETAILMFFFCPGVKKIKPVLDPP